jgi:hypothetical protein
MPPAKIAIMSGTESMPKVKAYRKRNVEAQTYAVGTKHRTAITAVGLSMTVCLGSGSMKSRN